MNQFFNFLDVGEKQFPTYIVVIIIIAMAIVFGFVIFLIFYFVRHRKPLPIDYSVWVEALGGRDNILYVVGIGSRLNISLKENEKIDREKLKELGVSSILVMSNKVTLVIEGQGTSIAEQMNNYLKNQNI